MGIKNGKWKPPGRRHCLNKTSWHLIFTIVLHTSIRVRIHAEKKKAPVYLPACSEVLIPNSGNVAKCTRYNGMEMLNLWIALFTKCYRIQKQKQ